MTHETLPDGQDTDEMGSTIPDELEPPPHRSLSEDVSALIADCKTYTEAELTFQKSRMSFAASKAKHGLLYGVAAFAFLHLALIGLVVGVIIALTPILTGWGAMAVVVGVLIIVGVVLALMAKKRFSRLTSIFRSSYE